MWLALLFLVAVAAQDGTEVCDSVAPPDSRPCGALVDVVIAFDSSMKSEADDQALGSLLLTIVNSYDLNGGDGPRIALVAFNDAATVIQPFTNLRAPVHAALNVRDPSVGNTCTTCALSRAQQLLETEGRANVRHVIILLSDGPSVRRVPCLDFFPIPTLAPTTHAFRRSWAAIQAR